MFVRATYFLSLFLLLSHPAFAETARSSEICVCKCSAFKGRATYSDYYELGSEAACSALDGGACIGKAFDVRYNGDLTNCRKGPRKSETLGDFQGWQQDFSTKVLKTILSSD